MRKELLTLLETEKKNGYKFEGHDKKKLVDQLLLDIGHRDSYVRDTLVYPALFHLFYDHHLSNIELTEYTKQLISDDYLFYDMDNTKPYSVLKRTFSLLQLVVMVYLYNKEHIFGRVLLKQIYKRIILYINTEEILIGYSNKVGWVDSVPHSADVCKQLMQCPDLGQEELQTIFDTLGRKFMIGHFHYTSTEDERVINALMFGLDRDEITTEFVKDWVTMLSTYEVPEDYPDKIYIKRNVTHLLRAFYFRILNQEKYQDLVPHVLETLQIIQTK